MATTLNLRSSTDNAISTFRDALPAVGSSSVFATVDVVSSGTNIQWTGSSGGLALAWISGRVPSGGFTLAGSVSVRLWARESSSLANCGGRIRLYKRTSGGTETEIGGSPWDDDVELSTATSLHTWSFTPTSTAFAENDRLLIRFFITDEGGTMAAGGPPARTCVLNYNNTAGASADSGITINETVAFKAESSTGTLSVSQADHTSVATAKVLLGGTLAASQAGNTVVGTGKVIDKGTLAVSQAGDFLFGLGQGEIIAAGTLFLNQSDNTLAGQGNVRVQGSLIAAQQADNVLLAIGNFPVAAGLVTAESVTVGPYALATPLMDGFLLAEVSIGPVIGDA